MSGYLERIKRFEFKIDPQNGYLIGPDGCHYDNEAAAMYFDQIGLCGCGSPGEVHQFLLDCMSATKETSDILDYEKIKDLIKANPDTVTQLVLHFLDSRDLTEHGGSVWGSWLTDRGKQVLEIGAMKDD